MKIKHKLFITLFLFLISTSAMYASGIKLDGHFGESNGVDLGYTFGKNNNWVCGAMIGSHIIKYTYDLSSSSGTSNPVSKTTTASDVGAFFGFQYPIYFLNLGFFSLGAEPAINLFADYFSYSRYDNSGSRNSSSGFELGLSFTLSLIGKINRFETALGWRGDFHLTESLVRINNYPFQNSFYVSLRYMFRGRSGSRVGSGAASSRPGLIQSEEVRILPIPGTNVPSYQKVE